VQRPALADRLARLEDAGGAGLTLDVLHAYRRLDGQKIAQKLLGLGRVECGATDDRLARSARSAPLPRRSLRRSRQARLHAVRPLASSPVSTSSKGKGHCGGASARPFSRFDVIYGQKVICGARAERCARRGDCKNAAGGPRCTCRRNLYSRPIVGSRPGRDAKGNAVRARVLDLVQRRGCPRNCRRRAFLDEPLEDTPGRSRRALSREPGDLPATQHIPGPRVEGIWSMI
jgi:hypothetical protein